MNHNEFFVLQHGWATRYYWLTTVSGADKRKEKIEDLIKKRDVLFAIKTGATPGDIVGSTWALNFFSERLVHFLKQKGAELIAYPIKFEKGLRISMKYYYVEPSARPVPIINKEGTVRWIVDSKGRRSVFARRGLYLDFKRWDGSDLFNIENSNITVVTKRLKKLLNKAKFKNLEFTDVKDYSFGVM